MSPGRATQTMSRDALGRGTQGPKAPDMADALEPVTRALLLAAQARADDLRARTDIEVRDEVSEARARARGIVDEARAEGERAAEWISGSRLSAARREARNMVLAARRRAFEKLRHRAVDDLARRAESPEGQMLSARLSELIGERLGGGAKVKAEGGSSLELAAESGSRRASIGPGDLVDQVLSSMSAAVEEMWS